MKFVQDIISAFFARAEAVDLTSDESRKIDGSLGEVRRYETIIGELPDELKKMFVILERDGSQLNARRVESGELISRAVHCDPSVTPKERTAVIRQLMLEDEQELISKAFWTGVKTTFPEAAIAQAIGMRKGWKLVSYSKFDAAMSRLSRVADLCEGHIIVMGSCGGCGQGGGSPRNPGA